MANSVSGSRRQVALVFLLAAALFTTGIVSDPALAGTTHRSRGEMLTLTNDDREAKHRRAVDLNLQLSRYAKRHSQAMADRGELFHTANLAAKLDGLDWTIGGENVGVGPDLAGLESAFMASDPHRKNILRRGFYETAIGVVESNGNYWVTVIFYG